MEHESVTADDFRRMAEEEMRRNPASLKKVSTIDIEYSNAMWSISMKRLSVVVPTVPKPR